MLKATKQRNFQRPTLDTVIINTLMCLNTHKLHDKITFLNLIRYTWLTVDTHIVICYSQQQGRHKGTHYVKIALQNFFQGEHNYKRTEQDSIQDHTFITVAENVPPPQAPSLSLRHSSLSVKKSLPYLLAPAKTKLALPYFGQFL